MKIQMKNHPNKMTDEYAIEARRHYFDDLLLANGGRSMGSDLSDDDMVQDDWSAAGSQKASTVKISSIGDKETNVAHSAFEDLKITYNSFDHAAAAASEQVL